MAKNAAAAATKAPAKKAAARPAARAATTPDKTPIPDEAPVDDELEADDGEAGEDGIIHVRLISGTPEAQAAIEDALAHPSKYKITTSTTGKLESSEVVTHILEVVPEGEAQPGDRVFNTYTDPRSGNEIAVTVRARQTDIAERFFDD